MKICGNKSSLERIKILVDSTSSHQIIAISGPSNIGKSISISEVVNDSFEESDRIIIGSSIDDARDAALFLSVKPAFCKHRIIVVDNVESMSEPAQDAYLKLCEEPPLNTYIWFITSDIDLMLPALHSRIQETIKWLPLNFEEMREFLDSVDDDIDLTARDFCSGRPGIYLAIANNTEFYELRDAVFSFLSGDYGIEKKVPDIIRLLDSKSLNSKSSVLRTSVSEVCRMSVHNFIENSDYRDRSISLLNFASILLRYPTANAELHWQNTLISCLL